MAVAATPPEHTVSSVASDGVAYFIHWLIILLLLVQAIVLPIQATPGQAADLAASVVCLLWATFCLGMGVLRGTRPEGGDQPPPAWLGVVTTAGCLISLEVTRSADGSLGTAPSQTQLLVGGLLVGSLTVWRGVLVGGVAAVTLATLALVVPAPSGTPGALLSTWLSEVVPAVAMLAAGFSLALALVALGRAARGLQRTLDAWDAELVREQAVREAVNMAAEAERSLHDTALNTLETIAAHGDHLDPAVVAQRCRWDHEQLSRWREDAGFGDLDDVARSLAAHARRLGIDLGVARVVEPAPDAADGPAGIPRPVLGAIAGAGREALTNVSKHAGVPGATVLVRHDAQGVQVFVADEGSGADPEAAGFGVTHSIQERMASVGGWARTRPGPDGRGTVVVIQWLREEPPGEEITTELLGGTARVVLVVGMFLAGTACALIVLGWPAYSRGWLALVGALAPVLVAADIVERARSGRRVGLDQVVAACATYVLVGALAQLADPYCSALRGEGALLDARIPMMAVLLLIAPRVSVLAAIGVTVVGTHMAAAFVWNERWLLCGPETAQAGVYVVAALVACWFFVERVDRMTTELARARWQAIEVQVRIRAELAIRAEEEVWVADTLARAQDLLREIGAERRSPGDPATRAACAAEAEYLRAWLAIGHAPQRLHRVAQDWVRAFSAHGCPVQVRGSFVGAEIPDGTVASIDGVVAEVCRLAPGARVTLSVWASLGSTVVLAAEGAPVDAALPALRDRAAGLAQGAWVDVDEDRLTVEWAPAGEMPDLVGRSS